MELEIIETLGGDYHIVELEEPIKHAGDDTWYHDEYLDVDAWCEQTFGPQDIWGSEPVSGWKRMRNRYYFVDENKLSWFMVRWQ
jgi:hypothetical protein